jgi:hypothetical protein
LDYQHFHRLLENGESPSCIFMKECKALNGATSDDAELAKHIVALANNETAINYIIIGISNDGEYQSVNNRNLTQENLQTFCQESVFPVPTVSLERYVWEKPEDELIKGKTFVVIQVESQARQCFRLNQEFYNSSKNCYCKKGEVWVRHNRDTEFASPEEIKKLFEKKRIEAKNHKINYLNFPYATILPYIIDELEDLAAAVGGKVYGDVDPFIVRGGPSLFYHIMIPVHGKPLLLRIVPVEKCTEKGQIAALHNIYLTFEHGILLISLNEVAETALDSSDLKSSESWGWFCTHPYMHPGLKERNLNIPLSEELKPLVGEPSSLCFAFSNVANNKILARSLSELISAIQTKDDLVQTIEYNRDRINVITASYLKEGCPLPTNKTFKPKNLLGNELWAPKKYGEVLLNRQPEICNALRYLADKMIDF